MYLVLCSHPHRLFIISRMPKLKFLDAKMIDESEWSIIHANTSSIIEEQPMQSDAVVTPIRKGWWKRIFGGKKDDTDTLENSSYSPLPADVSEISQPPRTSYGRIKHHYKGTESQGNRFIGNTML